MADVKITALTAIGLNPVNPATFPMPMVDLLDNSMAASGSTRKVTVNQILGSGGTATLASATITGALTVDTTTLVANAAGYTDKVGIGTATPGAELEVYKSTNGLNRVFINNPSTGASAYSSIDLTTGTTGGKILQLGSGYSGSYPYITGSTVIQNDSVGGVTLHSVGPYPIYFGTNNIERLRINSSGNLVFAGGTAGATGVGVTFPSTQSASSDANCLDDYEEGTFTPGITFGGASVLMAGTFSGRYTKVGRAVTVNGIITLTNKGSSTGNAKITGLPFTSANAAGEFTSVSLRLDRVSFLNVPCGYVGQNISHIELENITTAGTVTNLTDANFINTSVVIWNCTYTV